MPEKTVLLVEDDLDLRDVLQDILEVEGYDVVPAYNGRQALQYLMASGEPAPDVILLDLMMPVISGWQVLSAIRDEPTLSHVPVIVISAAGRGKPAGAAEYFSKPFSLAALIDSVHTHADVAAGGAAP